MKKWIPILVGLVVAGGTVALLLSPGPAPGEPSGQSDDEIIATMASKHFEKLPAESRHAYTEEFRSRRRDPGTMKPLTENLSDSERERFRANIGNEMRGRMMERVDEYFALPTQERTAFLDRMIDQQDARRREWQQRAGSDQGASDSPSGSQETRGRGPLSAERLKGFIENRTPEERARMLEFFKAMRERREERGGGVDPAG